MSVSVDDAVLDETADESRLNELGDVTHFEKWATNLTSNTVTGSIKSTDLFVFDETALSSGHHAHQSLLPLPPHPRVLHPRDKDVARRHLVAAHNQYIALNQDQPALPAL